mmetsp:Transcript_60668/g.160528  ORF Transcript_60668/g.160528 Transcript_60668/m.160528 type:complete len:211 (+) Transcript_60668:60-692(+)
MYVSNAVRSTRLCETITQSVGGRASLSSLHAPRRAQKSGRPYTVPHVAFVTASCARKPAAAIMPRRACTSSFSCMRRNSAGSSGARPSGSKPRSPGVYEGLSAESAFLVSGSSGWKPTAMRCTSHAPMPIVRTPHSQTGSCGIWSIAGPPSPEKSGWNFSCTRKPAAASMPTRPCASSASRHVSTWSLVLPFSMSKGSKLPTGDSAPGRP